MPGKHNAGGCKCCCVHCPDYPGTWTALICGVVIDATRWTFAGIGTPIEPALNGVAFSGTISGTPGVFNPTTNFYRLDHSITFANKGYNSTTYGFVNFSAINITVDIYDDCQTNETWSIVQAFARGRYFNMGIPIDIDVRMFLSDTSPKKSGCGQFLESTGATNTGALIITNGGTSQAQVGAVSLTC